jgi:hypothetical protein
MLIKDRTAGIIVIGLFIFIQANACSQTELSVQAGYQLTGNIPVTKGDIDIKNDLNYGLGIAYRLSRGVNVVLDWDMEKTKADLLPLSGESYFLTNVTIHHFMAGATIDPGRGKARPFGSFTTGITLFHPEDSKYEDEIRYTIALGFGGKFYLSDRVGLKLQARLILPLQLGGGTFWCGTGGCGLGVSSWSTFVQGDFSGSLFIRI